MIKKYNIIYADPPWSYRDKAAAGNRGAAFKYDLMSQVDIAALPVKDIAAPNSVLFMWVTMPKLPDCFEIIKAWGFEYKTVAFTWIKLNKSGEGHFMGMGNWTRANAELCLIATRGKPKRISASVRQVIEAPLQAHSKKPDIIRGKIVQLCGDLPRVELFARQKAIGWDAWGNQIESDIKL